ncbi:YihY/virulence factor BrkB family protein [soil metagenome]
MPRFDTTRLKRQLERMKDSLPVELGRRFVETDLLTHAASLSFFALVSLAPLLVLLLWLTASRGPSAQSALSEELGMLAGRGAEHVAVTVIENATRRPDVGSLAGLWSTLLLLVGATAVFARLQGTLNLIFRSDAKRLGGLKVWLRKRVLSFGVVLSLGFLLLVSVSLTTALQLLFAGAPSLLPLMGDTLSLLLYALAFGLLYHYLPDRRVGWRQALLGGAITAALFVLGRWAIGIYLVHAAPDSAYGSMGTLVLLLVWMYYAAMVFFGGALITAVIDERMRRASVARKLEAREARSPSPSIPG